VIFVLEWKIGRLYLRFTFSFFAVFGLVCAVAGSVQVRLCLILICSLMHETGHIAAMYIFGIRPESLTFCGGGISLSENALRCSVPKRAVILLSGCFVDLVSAAVSILLGHKGMFAAVHIILGVFNLLPFRYFDGGRLYTELTGKEPSLLMKAAAMLLLGIIASVSLLHGNIPLSLIVTAAVLIADG